MSFTPSYDGGNYQGVGDKYAPNEYAELGNMIGKIGFSIVKNVMAKNPLSVFTKTLEDGDTVEQAVVKLVEGYDYDLNGAHTLDRDTTSKMAVAYFKDIAKYTYKRTIDYAELRKILTGKDQLKTAEEVASKLVAGLTEGQTHEKYGLLKGLLAYARQSSDGGTSATFVDLGDVTLNGNGKTDIPKMLKLMKNTVKGMQYVKTSYNTAGIKQSSKADDIFIIMPYQLVTEIDVDELAGVFNLDKAEIRSKIIEIDVDDASETANGVTSYYNFVYIVDRWAILDYLTLYLMDTQKNAEGHFFNYFLNVEYKLGTSKLFNSCYFKYYNDEH